MGRSQHIEIEMVPNKGRNQDLGEFSQKLSRAVLDLANQMNIEYSCPAGAIIVREAFKQVVDSGHLPATDPNEEPPHDDSVKCCPDCERPNQFGEQCESCRQEEQIRIQERQNEEPPAFRGDDVRAMALEERMLMGGGISDADRAFLSRYNE